MPTASPRWRSSTAAQGEAETSFPTAQLDLTMTEGEMPGTEADFRDALAESRFRDLAAGRTLVGPHRADLYGVYAAKGVPARDCSTGEQKALLVSLILANARALKRDFGAAPSCCWTRSPPIWTPPAVPPFTTRFARWARRPG